MDKETVENGIDNVILVGHSFACPTIVFWANKYHRKINRVLLVAPIDTEAEIFPFEPLRFSPIPIDKLPFKSIVVASSSDSYAKLDSTNFFPKKWGREFINIGEAGHISSTSEHENWNYEFEILKKLNNE